MPAPGWRVAGTSVAGPCHANDDCQDRHRVHVTPGGVLIAVVSDGAGSARFGAQGAALLCDHVVERLNACFGSRRPGAAVLAASARAVEEGIAAARASAEAAAQAQGARLEAFHATLVGAVVARGRGGLFFHIGDGAALALDPRGQRWLLSAPQNGEYADTTFFFTEDAWRDNLRFKPIEPGYDTIFVMSDGVTELGLKHNGQGAEPFMPFFERSGASSPGRAARTARRRCRRTLDSSAVRERTADDKTLVWAQAR
ncbi:MAG: PP2C family serine/threonine-protein phosphatase [Sphingomonas sp.]